MSTQEKSRSLYVYESNPPLGKILPVSLQHIIAMFLGTVTVPMVVGGAANVDAATQTLMIQYSLMMAAVATLLQVFRIGPVGARLPIVFSAGFTCVPIFTPIAGQFGLAGVFGSQLIFSVLIILLGLCVGKIHKLFPPIVTGTIIMSIGLSLYPIALKYMAGSEGSAGYGDLRNWLVGAITLAAVLIFNLLGRGLIKMASILLGAIVGYIAALCLNMVSFDSVAAASWISLPQPFYYGMPTFDVSMVLPIVLITVVNVMQSVGDLTGTCVGGFNREPSAKELSGGVISSGISSLLGCVFGVPATSTYSQNVGIVSMSKVVSRMVLVLASVIMLALGLVPKFSALVSTMPAPVIGGGTLIVFGMITMTGLQLIASEPLTGRDTIIVGVSVALGLGLSTLDGSPALAQFPSLAQTLLVSPVVVAGVVAFVLNLVTPKRTMEEEAQERADLDAK